MERRGGVFEKYFAGITTPAIPCFVNACRIAVLLVPFDHLVMFRGRLMNPDRFPLIFRSVQFWPGLGGVPAAEKPTFVSGEIEHDGIELWAAFPLSWVPIFILSTEGYFEIFIFATSGLNFFKEEKGWTIIGKDLFSRLSFEEILSRLLDTRYGLIFIF